MVDSLHPLDPRRDEARTFAELALITLEAISLEQALRRLADLARQVLPGVEHVSLTLVERGRPRAVVFTDRLAVHLDERQYERGFGPSFDAARAGQAIVVDHDDDGSPYREFARLAHRAGVRHTVALGVPLAHGSLGLNLHSTAETAFATDVIEQAEQLARYAAVAVSNVCGYTRTVEQVGQLRTARESRGVIEQAKGILMAQLRCTADEAFALLRRLSQNGNTRLTEIARSVVADVDP